MHRHTHTHTNIITTTICLCTPATPQTGSTHTHTRTHTQQNISHPCARTWNLFAFARTHIAEPALSASANATATRPERYTPSARCPCAYLLGGPDAAAAAVRAVRFRHCAKSLCMMRAPRCGAVLLPPPLSLLQRPAMEFRTCT